MKEDTLRQLVRTVLGGSKTYGVTLPTGYTKAYAQKQGISEEEAKSKLWPQTESFSDHPMERGRAASNKAIETWIESATGGPTAILASHGARLAPQDLSPLERHEQEMSGVPDKRRMGIAYELLHKNQQPMTIMDFHRMLDEVGDKSKNTLISMCNKGSGDQQFCDSLKVAAAGFPDTKSGQLRGTPRNIFTPIGATSKDSRSTSKGMMLTTPEGRQYTTSTTNVAQAIKELRAQASRR